MKFHKVKMLAATTDTDAICVAQSGGSAGYLTLDGVDVTDGVGYMHPNCSRQMDTSNNERTMSGTSVVHLNSTGINTGVTATVTGRSSLGKQIIEDVALGGIGGYTTVANFQTVTSIYMDGAYGTISAGRSDKSKVSSPEIIISKHGKYGASIGVAGSGTVVGNVHVCLDNDLLVFFSMGNLSTTMEIPFNVSAVRIHWVSGSGETYFYVSQ